MIRSQRSQSSATENPGRINSLCGRRKNANKRSSFTLPVSCLQQRTPSLLRVRFAGRFLLAVLLFTSPLEAVAARIAQNHDRSPVQPRVFLLDIKFLESVRYRLNKNEQDLMPALARLRDDARKAMSAGPFSVVDKTATPPSGDKHDYMSQAPYFWPDPNTPTHLPYIRRDGERNPEINKYPDHQNMDKMVAAVETLALEYYFDSDEACAEQAGRLLRAWFIDPATRMNPNLEYAQAIPGINTGRGIGLIETRGLIRVVDAVGLLAGSKSWNQSDQRGLKQWFGKFLQWMLDSKNGRDESAAKNNHGTYYDVQVASFALFVGRKDLAVSVLRAAARKRIEAQIEPDGR